MGSEAADVIVIGGGHNGLVCGAYMARAGLEVVVLEAAAEPGGCVATEDAPEAEGFRFEIGAIEHAGFRASGIPEELDLARHGLRYLLRDEVALAPLAGGALPVYADLERTVEAIAQRSGAEEGERYRRFAGVASAVFGLLGVADDGPPPSFRELALGALALGSDGERLLRLLLAPASSVLERYLTDDGLRALHALWAVHSQLPAAQPGTGAGALMLAAAHGSPAARVAGGGGAFVQALVSALEAGGGRLRTSAPVEAVELAGGRAGAVRLAGGERVVARRAIVSTLDVKRLLGGLVEPGALPPDLLDEVRAVGVGRNNVSELKLDLALAGMPELPGPAGFERALILSPVSSAAVEREFACIAAGELAEEQPLMAFLPSVQDPGFAPAGKHVLYISCFVPWRLREGPWTKERLDAAADRALAAVERWAPGVGGLVEARRVTGPDDWARRTGMPFGNPNHVDMSVDQLLGLRPLPGLAAYRTPIAGLYLSGAGTHPGGGVTGRPGRNAAAVILSDLDGRAARGAALRARAALARDALAATRSASRALSRA